MWRVFLAFVVTTSFVAGESKSQQPLPATAPAPASRKAGGADAAEHGGAASAEDQAARAVGAKATGTDDRGGYVDEMGQFVIQRRFDQAYNFAASLAAVSAHGKWGFINSRGEYAIKPAFDQARSFREGLAAVSIAGKGWGFIQTSGAWAIPPGFAVADSFSDGLAVVRDDPAAAREAGGYDDAEDAATPADSACESESDDDPDADTLGKYFLIDRTGKTINRKGYHCIKRMSEGLAAVRWKDHWGYVDRDGKEVIPPRFKRALRFGEGLAAVLVEQKPRASDQGNDDDDFWQGKWGLIDLQGRFVVRPQLRAQEVGVFSEGLIAIEGLSSRVLMTSALGRKAVARRAKDMGLTPHRFVEEKGGELWGGYPDRKGTLRVAAPYCYFDDAPAGQRSFREMSGGVAKVLMQAPLSVAPFKCADAMMRDVTLFLHRRKGYVRPPISFLMGQSSERLVPKCGRDGKHPAVDEFTW